MEETNDVIPVNEKNSSKFRLCYFELVVTNNEDFKILKNMIDFYLLYKKTHNKMQIQSNYIKWVFLKRLENIFSIYI